jgi:hypothetical protein
MPLHNGNQFIRVGMQLLVATVFLSRSRRNAVVFVFCWIFDRGNLYARTIFRVDFWHPGLGSLLPKPDWKWWLRCKCTGRCLGAFRLGMTGIEDLGNGYSAIFKLGSGFSTTSGGFGNSNGNLFGWNSYVGVNGPYGDIHAGVQFSPFFLSVVRDDARGGPQYASNVSVFFDRFGGSGLFESNSLIYTSPTIAGFDASFEYAFGNVAGSPAAERHYSAALNYRQGPLTATLAYFEANAPQASQTAFIGQNVGLGYKVGPIDVHASYTKYRNELVANCNDVDVYAGGLTWLLTPSLSFNTGVYYNRDTKVSTNNSLLVGVGSFPVRPVKADNALYTTRRCSQQGRNADVDCFECDKIRSRTGDDNRC